MSTPAERRALLAKSESCAAEVRHLSKQIVDAVSSLRPNLTEIERLTKAREAAGKRWGQALQALDAICSARS